jgi:ABC-type transport system involved in cytochrome c biogenesis permease subunit
MEIKFTILGLLIYLALMTYFLAISSMLRGLIKTGNFIYLFGFVFALIAYGYRWYQVRHVPLQNLFEVFLGLSVLIYPFTLFCRRFLGIKDVKADIIDIFVGIIVLVPPGFIFSARPQQLPPALQSWLFVPHVFVYMISYIFMTKAMFYASRQLVSSRRKSFEEMQRYEEAAYRMVCMGFPLLTLGLILGSWWGQAAWADYWGWDPKEQWSLASWLIYVGYLHFRYMFGKKFSRINSIWVIAGMTVIVITLLWVNLSAIFAGLHSYAI